MKFSNLALPLVALGAAAVLLTPGSSDGFSFIGGLLGQGQRDFRTYNNFTDTQANNNGAADDQFPGAVGAVLSIWKASIEWGSELHGDGSGDPHQAGNLGSGGANFDPSFQNEATGVGGVNDNIHSELSGGSGGVLAFTETPINNGWRIRYYSTWTWHDGPGTSIPGTDLQGVACHEYGHALGLGHSSSFGATMYPSISGSGVSQRSLATDDKNGVQAVYGVKSGTKPHLASVTVVGNQVTVTGTGFNSSGNEIWFTRNTTGNGTPVKATGLPSPTGTSITTTLPALAGPGDVLVRRNSTANSGLSNAFPSDLVSIPGGGGTPSFSSASPTSLPAVVIDGPGVVTFTGSDFTGISSMTVDGITLTGGLSPQFTVVNDTTLTAKIPLVSKLGSVAVTATNASGTGNTTFTIVANTTPVMDMLSSSPGFLFTTNGLTLIAGGIPGDIIYMAASPSNVPSPFPGVVDLAIGDAWQSVFILGAPTIPAEGYFVINEPMVGLPTGLKVYSQGAAFLLLNFFAFPMTTTNVQDGTILF